MTDFNPTRLLRNCHVQSLGASLDLRKKLLRMRSSPVLKAARPELMHLPVDGGVWLSAHISRQPQSSGRLAILLHGWEGSVDSNYLLATADTLFRSGYDVARLNFRDHGNTHGLNSGVFHSCRLDEVVAGVAEIIKRERPSRVGLAGFSLGGNFALRVACRANELPLPLSRVVSVCPVIVPANALDMMENGWALYRHYFVRKWQRSLARKQSLWPALYDFRDEMKMSSLTDMTTSLVERYTEFDTVEQYLDGYAVAGDRLLQLAAPTTIISAADDPVVPTSDLDLLPQIPNLDLIKTRYGGHCGFLDTFSVHSWIEPQIVRLFEYNHEKQSDHEHTAAA
ncbi:MAG: alpha/beta hydrolase [Lysobacteraceae bacterium]|nr:MAG: alpha/beta hydrolase [Xanthomonadaceae bacterium]